MNQARADARGVGRGFVAITQSEIGSGVLHYERIAPERVMVKAERSGSGGNGKKDGVT